MCKSAAKNVALQLSITITVAKSGSSGDDRVCVRIPGSVAITSSFRSEASSQDWEAVPAMLLPDSSWELVGTAIRFQASVHDCNSALATLHYIPSAPIHPVYLSLFLSFSLYFVYNTHHIIKGCFFV